MTKTKPDNAAAEPPAPPAQVLTPQEVHFIRLARVPNLTHRDVVELADSHEALRAEVARLQAQLADAAAVITQLGQNWTADRSRAAELEAAAQALLELAEVRLATDSAVLKSLAPGHRKSIIAGQLQVWQQVLALLSPAQEAPK
jgi:hypothetical protein